MAGAVSKSERILAVLGLFSIERPIWTPEEVADELGTSLSTAYRHLAALFDEGLVTTVSAGRYTLGPAIIQYDRQIQLTDPLLLAARPIMLESIQYAPPNSVMLLCRLFHNSVLCVHQVSGSGPAPSISYERGRPMPLLRGATSKIILAHLSPRALVDFYNEHAVGLREARLGNDLKEFRKQMSQLRRTGYSVARGEVDDNRAGIAAAVLDAQMRVVGSLSYVVPISVADDQMIARLSTLVVAGSRQIEVALSSQEPLAGMDIQKKADAEETYTP